MASPALPTMPIPDYLTRKLLRKIAGTGTPLTALLEQLVTDSVYTLKDDFDKGLNPAVWETLGLVDQVEDEGSLVSDSGDDDSTQGMYILSVGSGWRLNRRPCFQTRVDFSPSSRPAHFEMGFISEMPTNGFGVVTGIASSATSRNPKVQTFAVAARDANFADPDSFYNVSGGRNAANAQDEVGSTIVVPNPALEGPMTLMVAANEQGETRLWINGQHDNSFSEEADVVPSEGLHLWMFGTKGSYSIDYIQAWRERKSL